MALPMPSCLDGAPLDVLVAVHGVDHDGLPRALTSRSREVLDSSKKQRFALMDQIARPLRRRERRRVGRPDRPVMADSPRLAWDRGESAMTGPSGLPTCRRSRIPGGMPTQPTRPSAEGTCEELVANSVSVCMKPRAVSSKRTSEFLGRGFCCQRFTNQVLIARSQPWARRQKFAVENLL